MTGLVYFQASGGQDGVQNVYGALFFFVSSTSYLQLYSVAFTFPEERVVFLREHHSGMYRTDVYFLSKTFAQAPQFFVGPLLSLSIGYWMMGLRADALRFFYAYGILALVAMAAVSFAYVISAIAPTAASSLSIMEPMILPLLLLGGFFKENTTLPEWLRWVQYLSWWNYGFEAMVVNQWDNYGNITCKFQKNRTHPPCIYNGDQAIDARGLDKDHVLIDIYGLLSLMVGFRITAFLILLRSTYKKP